MHRTLALGVVIGIMLVGGVSRADDATIVCREPPADRKIEVVFKPDVSVAELGVWVSSFTCKNVVFAPEVAKRATKVDIVAPRQVTPKQALQLFLDAIDAVGLVATIKPDTIIIKQGPRLPLRCPDIAEAPPSGPTDAEREQQELSDALDRTIHKVDATHVKVKRELVDRILSNPMAVAKSARVIAAIKDGATIGFKLYSIRPGSMYARLGFQNGDTLLTINGLSLTSADKALEAYTKIRDASELKVVIERGGSPLALTFTFD